MSDHDESDADDDDEEEGNSHDTMTGEQSAVELEAYDKWVKRRRKRPKAHEATETQAGVTEEALGQPPTGGSNPAHDAGHDGDGEGSVSDPGNGGTTPVHDGAYTAAANGRIITRARPRRRQRRRSPAACLPSQHAPATQHQNLPDVLGSRVQFRMSMFPFGALTHIYVHFLLYRCMHQAPIFLLHRYVAEFGPTRRSLQLCQSTPAFLALITP